MAEEEEYRRARAEVRRKGVDVEGYFIEGVSVGGHETCVVVPSLNAAFDIGRCPPRAVHQDFLFITHAHIDHIGGLPLYLATRGLYSLKPPTVFVPPCIKEEVEKLLEIHRTMSQTELELELVALDVGETYEIRNDVVVRPFRTHHVIASQVGFNKSTEGNPLSLKKTRLCHLFSEKKTEKTVCPFEGHSNQEVEALWCREVAYSGETMSDFIHEPQNADALRAKILITEVSFSPSLPDRTSDGPPAPEMGDEGSTEAGSPHAAQAAAPATKKRVREGADTGDLKRVAGIVMMLAAMGEMRGGREPTAAEKALVAEAWEKLVGMCEHVKPKDLFSREAVRVVVDDLGLDRSKDHMMGCRPPKMSIAEKVLLTKRKWIVDVVIMKCLNFIEFCYMEMTGDLKRVAGIVMMLAAMGEMRGGREPTAAEKALVAEAWEKLVGMCEHVKPKDLFSREAVRVVVDDLGLDRSKDHMMGCRPPKMSIAEKVLLTKRKMEESKEVATHSAVYSSHHFPASFGANVESHGTLFHGASRFVPEKPITVALPAGGYQSASPVSHVPTLASAISSSKKPQINETHAAVTPIKSTSNPHQRDSPSLTLPHAEPGCLRLDARLNGPTYQTQAQDKLIDFYIFLYVATSAECMPHKTPTSSMQLTSAAVTKVGRAHKLPDHGSVKSEGIHEGNAIQNSQAIRNQEIRSSAMEVGQGNLRIAHQPPPGLAFVHSPPPFTNHDDIAKNVQKILHQKGSDHPSWTPPSTEYMTKPLNCQVCKISISDLESLLVCDACEKGTHLKCLQSYGNKSIPKAEWHCPKCLISSNGKPLPPKYGKVTRAVGPSKVASNAGVTQASSEKKTVNTDSKVNQQKAIANGNSGLAALAHPSNRGGSHAESASGSKMNIAEVQSKSPAARIKREDGMSKGASTNPYRENAGAVCIISSTQNESNDRHNDNSGSSSCDMKATSESMLQPKAVPENSCSEHPYAIVVDNTNQSQLSGDLQFGGVKLPSHVEASAIPQQEISKPGDNELKRPFIKRETSENRAINKTRLDDGDSSQATSNGTPDYGDEARDHGRPLLLDLHTVDWVGDVLQVVDEKMYYQSCRINGILYKLQDHVLIDSNCQKFVPSKLQASLYSDHDTVFHLYANTVTYLFPLCYFIIQNVILSL
ncbi:hypothetical protein COCNU_01G012480 [Cocos nucifera]|uniref:PHD-type domain-containing protein n=1 Tax=Cocos nucifera TaxID=13894 RepID=A0A8K0HVK4_COCNU|nr:hypothetical protein COCNU_01G012480 [Cocos nucifera]